MSTLLRSPSHLLNIYLTLWLPQVTGDPNVWSTVAFAFYIFFYFFLDILLWLKLLKRSFQWMFFLIPCTWCIAPFRHISFVQNIPKITYQVQHSTCFLWFLLLVWQTYLDHFCKWMDLKAFITPYLIKETTVV